VQVSASGVFQLEVGPWRNALGVTADGRCCESGEVASPDGEVCPGPCRTFLRVCLSHYQAVIPEQPDCTYGSVVTGTDHFNPDSTLRRHNVNIPFEFAWPASIHTFWPTVSLMIPQARRCIAWGECFGTLTESL